MDKTTQSVKTAKKPLTNNTTQRYLPFSEIRDNLVVMKDWSFKNHFESTGYQLQSKKHRRTRFNNLHLPKIFKFA